MNRKVFAEWATQSTLSLARLSGVLVTRQKRVQGVWKTTPKSCGKQGKNSAGLRSIVVGVHRRASVAQEMRGCKWRGDELEWRRRLREIKTVGEVVGGRVREAE